MDFSLLRNIISRYVRPPLPLPSIPFPPHATVTTPCLQVDYSNTTLTRYIYSCSEDFLKCFFLVTMHSGFDRNCTFRGEKHFFLPEKINKPVRGGRGPLTGEGKLWSQSGVVMLKLNGECASGYRCTDGRANVWNRNELGWPT